MFQQDVGAKINRCYRIYAHDASSGHGVRVSGFVNSLAAAENYILMLIQKVG